MNLNIGIKALLLALVLLLCAGQLCATSFGERTAQSLKDRGIQPWLIVILISMLPIVELRGAIPVAMAVLGMPWPQAVLLSILGNMLPIPFILLFIDWFFDRLRVFRWGVRFTDWITERANKRSAVVERYQELGLAIFVGIPLPGTGAWTGALVAKLFKLPFWSSLLWIFIGVLIAAAAVTALTLLGLLVVT